MSRLSNRPRWPSRSSASPGRRPSAIGMGRSAGDPAASRTAASRSAGSCRAGATASSCDGTGSWSATPSPRPSRSTCRASTSGRSRSCSGRVSRGPRTAPGTRGGHIRSSPADARADLKILCGDQVYLDQPTTEFLGHTHNADQLRERHLGNYANAWSQTGGFRELLRVGGTYFSSDDHDFWNNSPNPTIIARDTWFQQGRDDWKAAAKALYGAFQRPVEAAAATFKVGHAVVLRRRHAPRPDHRAGRLRDRRPARQDR